MQGRWPKCAGIALVPFLTLPIHAQTRSQVYGDELTRQAQTLYVRATTGMTTFDSEAAGSKDTQSSTRYALGGWLGEGRLIGLQVDTHQDSLRYELNQSSTQQKFTDIRMAARIFWFVPSIGLSLSEIDVTTSETKRVGLFSTGMNMGLGVNVNVYKGVVVHADLMRVTSNQNYDKIQNGTKLGDRREIDGNIAFDLTEHLIDLIVGYSIRSYDIATESESYREQSQGAYAGLRMGLYF